MIQSPRHMSRISRGIVIFEASRHRAFWQEKACRRESDGILPGGRLSVSSFDLILLMRIMRTLANPGDLQLIQLRLSMLTERDAAAWGRMNAHQMIRHLSDSMGVPLGEIRVADAEVSWLQRLALKWAALYVPLKWRPNFPTRPELDQCSLNLPLGDFETDRRKAIALAEHLSEAELEGRRHPYFGAVTRAQWLRWGWLHADHHLRQFGR